MKLSSGVRLGPYEIVSPIGAGGMGEVYRARDTRLDRTVAVKILPSEFATDARLRARFEREAKTISALNHPHICALYDVGPEYLVMEHCEGKTLAKRIAEGPLPFEQVLEYGMQMADALDKAHRQGIIHRDLKPSNVMLTKSGVKLLDFGLAKQHFESTVEESTLQRVSEEGQFVGTIQYMAPEVLQGKEADARSDIFALGLVLYEMVTGTPAFNGTSKASLIAAILEHEPQPIAELKPMTPPALDRLIRLCLEKDPDTRWQNAGDVARELSWIGESRAATTAQVSKGLRWMPWAALLAVAVVIGAIEAWRWSARKGTVARPERLSIALDAAPFAGPFSLELLALSPNGRQIAYASGDKLQLQLRSIDQFESKPVVGIDMAHNPFFSPDGKWLGFSFHDQLRKVPLSGGSPATICEAGEVHGAVWAADDTVVFARGWGGLQKVSAAGGKPSPLTNSALGTHRWPALLPGGRDVLFTALEEQSGNYERAHLAVVSLTTGKVTPVLSGATCGRYSPTGHLLFARNGSLFAVPFDVNQLKVTGSPTAVATRVLSYAFGGLTNYVVGPDGSIVYVPSAVEQPPDLVWLDRKGAATPLTITPRLYSTVRFSPNGQRVLFEAGDAEGLKNEIWIYDLTRQAWSLIAQAHAVNPLWSPDGQTVVYSSNENGPYNLFTVPADASTPPRQLTHRQGWPFASSWSPDARYLAVSEQTGETGSDIWIVDAVTGRETPFAVTGAAEREAVFSRDGRWIAYEEWLFPRPYVVVRPFPGPGPKQQVSAGESGRRPIWIGNEILYHSQGAVFAVDVKSGPRLVLGKPRRLFQADFGPDAFDVTPDGKRFLAIREKSETRFDHLNVVRGWWLEGGS